MLIINKKSGFTLAEILVTLTIIGIIAAQVIPTLVQNIQKQQTVAKVRKAYSELQQVYNSFVTDGTDMDTIFGGYNPNPAVYLNRFAAKLNVIKNCGTGTGCYPNVNYIDLKGDPFWNYEEQTNLAKAILADGTLIALDPTGSCTAILVGAPLGSPLQHLCAYIDIDINGFKGPNQAGRDEFAFWITRTGIFPVGSNDGINDCNTSDFGESCTSRVLTDGAVNY